MILKRLLYRVLTSLFTSKFEPIQVVVAFSSMAHGLWLLFPYWQFSQFGSGVTDAPVIIEEILGAVLMAVGLTSLLALVNRQKGLLRLADFLQFLMWTFFTMLAMFATGITHLVWFPFATLAFISGIIYLSTGITLGDDNE